MKSTRRLPRTIKRENALDIENYHKRHFLVKEICNVGLPDLRTSALIGANYVSVILRAPICAGHAEGILSRERKRTG